MPIDSSDLSGDADVYLEATSDEMLLPKPPARKGTLVVINTFQLLRGWLSGWPTTIHGSESGV